MVRSKELSLGSLCSENQETCGGRSREVLISSGDPIIRSSPAGPPRTPLADTGESHIFHVEELLERSGGAGSKPTLRQEVEEWLHTCGILYTLDLRPSWAAHASTITIVKPKDAIRFKLTWM